MQNLISQKAESISRLHATRITFNLCSGRKIRKRMKCRQVISEMGKQSFQGSFTLQISLQSHMQTYVITCYIDSLIF